MTKEEWDEFVTHRDYFAKRGAKMRGPYRQTDFSKPYWKTDGVSFWLLGPARHIAESATRELHDACLVIKAHLGQRKCLFAGDASDVCLEHVAAQTTHICDDILHASHHGSLEGAALSFVKKCNASYTVVSTEEGVYENVPHPTALRRYRKHTKNKGYRTDVDKSLEWTF